MLQVRVGKRSPQAALRIAVDMAEDASFPLLEDRGRRARRCRCWPTRPRLRARRAASCGRSRPGLPASPGLASGPIVTNPEAAEKAAARRTSDDPGPGRDLARRRPRDGPGGRHPDVPWRSREPCRGRRARLGHPRGRRRSRDRGRATARSRSASGSSRPATSITIDGSTGEVFEGAIPGTTEVVPEARTLLGLGARARHRRRCGRRRPRHREPRRPSPSGDAGTRRRDTPTTCLRAIAIKGFAPVERRGRRRPVDARRRRADRRPARRRTG